MWKLIKNKLLVKTAIYRLLAFGGGILLSYIWFGHWQLTFFLIVLFCYKTILYVIFEKLWNNYERKIKYEI